MTVLDHERSLVEATLKAPTEGPEKVYVLRSYPREGKVLVAYPKSSDPKLDIGEIGATVKVPISWVTLNRPVVDGPVYA